MHTLRAKNIKDRQKMLFSYIACFNLIYLNNKNELIIIINGNYFYLHIHIYNAEVLFLSFLAFSCNS